MHFEKSILLILGTEKCMFAGRLHFHKSDTASTWTAQQVPGVREDVGERLQARDRRPRVVTARSGARDPGGPRRARPLAVAS